MKIQQTILEVRAPKANIAKIIAPTDKNKKDLAE
jgi:hypothetical protein